MSGTAVTTKPDKPHYGTQYWVTELVRAGAALEPGKYTADYVKRLYWLWQGQSITRLHRKVMEKRDLLEKRKAVNPTCQQ